MFLVTWLSDTCVFADLPGLPAHVPAVTLLCKDVDEEGDEAVGT